MIRIRACYRLRKVLDIYLVMGIGSEAYVPNCIMSVNETGAFLWNLLIPGANPEELVSKLVEQFEVTEKAAARDVEKFLIKLREKALVEEC